MGIETKYDYIYYTVIHQNWFDEAERILNAELTTEILINVIERKLKNHNDWTLNNFKVDYSQRSEDIESWINTNVRHKEQPVFIQLEDDQPIITSGSGTLFVFYEERDEEDNQAVIDNPDLYEGSVDSLAGYGGRL
tara:strand:- start:419 stop:826 length:408 start_codon:yes stop_codon:yes gene_type:complete